MKLEEAKRKYGIMVPTDELFYSNEYKEYFSDNSEKKEINEKLEEYRAFEDMYKKSFLVTFHDNLNENLKFNNRKAIVLGGQTGAGKSGLVNLTKKEGMQNKMGFFLIDDDQFRKFYPHYDEIMAECPEFSTIITAIGSGPITPKIMKYASDNGMNFIFDGTMKNTRILETAKKWEGYDITYKVMATSRMESLLSVFERNAYLRRNGFGRPIGVKEHDDTYYGLEDTIKTLELKENSNIEIFMRGNNNTTSELIYSPLQRGMYKDAFEALHIGREKDKRRCIEATDINRRIANLETSEIGLNTNEYEELLKLKAALREEQNLENGEMDFY